MRETNKLVQELESLAWSNGCITERCPASWEVPLSYIRYPVPSRITAKGPLDIIMVDQRDSKRKDFAMRISHEVGHFFLHIYSPLLVQDLMDVAFRHQVLGAVYIIEKEAWREARYIMSSLGHLNKKELKMFIKAREIALKTYKKVMKGGYSY
jgi:hypothetical protein